MENLDTPRVTGIGGVFFKAKDSAALTAWYRDMLGIDLQEWGASFEWGVGTPGGDKGQTAFSIFKDSSNYYPGPFMVNFRVHRLRDLMDKLRAAGARTHEKIDESEYGIFGWVYDPEGNKVELWQEADSSAE